MKKILLFIAFICVTTILPAQPSSCASVTPSNTHNGNTMWGQSVTMSGCTYNNYFYSFSARNSTASVGRFTGATLGIYEGAGIGGTEIYQQTITWDETLDAINTIILTGGSGTLAYTPGNVYTFRFYNLTGGAQNFNLRRSGSDVYADGDLLLSNGTLDNAKDLYFDVQTTNTNPLPVELIFFNSEKKESDVALSWQTASETNNEGFEIEHSIDGRNWEMINFIPGTGTSVEVNSYSYTHQNPSSGLNYYRLKQIDFDGAFEYSKIVSVEVSARDRNMLFSPNPSREGGSVTLRIGTENFESGQLTIFDLNGKAVLMQDINISNPVIDVSNFAKGIYYATLISGREQLVEKLLIE